MAAISAHAPRAGTIEAYTRALETGAEYVEFDIRRTADGELAAFHDARTRQGEAGIETMIWTVDDDAQISRWLGDPRVTVLITNRPAEAVALRASLTRTALTPAAPQAP